MAVLAAIVAAAVLGFVGPTGAVAGAQDDDRDIEVPSGDIIPEPDSGRAPEEAGDRGGALQLLVFGIVVAALLGGGAWVAWQAKRNRDRYPPPSARIASQADTPSMNPDR